MRLDFGVDIVEVVVLWDADAHALYVHAEGGRIVFGRDIDTAGITRVVSRKGVQTHRGVGNGAGQRTDMIQRPGQRRHTGPAAAAKGRLEPDRAAYRGRDPDRSSGVGAHGHIGAARGDRRSRSAGGTARHPVSVPGITAIRSGDAIGKFVGMRLAENDRAGGPQLRDARTIRFRHPSSHGPGNSTWWARRRRHRAL